ncbi:MAG: hypothetical protein ACXU93_08775, partial [Thermodesulfobacteriota bacterium]
MKVISFTKFFLTKERQFCSLLREQENFHKHFSQANKDKHSMIAGDRHPDLKGVASFTGDK